MKLDDNDEFAILQAKRRGGTNIICFQFSHAIVTSHLYKGAYEPIYNDHLEKTKVILGIDSN